MYCTTMLCFSLLRLYLAGPRKIVLPINLTVCGDLTMVLYHARNAFKGMGRPKGLKIYQLQLNTGFIPEQETLTTYTASDFDELPDQEHVASSFAASEFRQFVSAVHNGIGIQ